MGIFFGSSWGVVCGFLETRSTLSRVLFLTGLGWKLVALLAETSISATTQWRSLNHRRPVAGTLLA